MNSTDPNAKEVFSILEGYTKGFMAMGYTEDESRARAGVYVGTVYAASGISGVLASGSLVKQFVKDVAPAEKPGNSAPGRKGPVYVEEPPFNPSGTGGAAQPWSTKGRIKYVELPTQGKIRFVPDSNYSSTNPLPKGPNNSYLNKFGNEWVKGPSRTAGQAFEWDVQLSPKGKAQLGWATRDGSRLNISLDGGVTHK